MPTIHHKKLGKQMDVPDKQVPIWTSTRSPWELGPLPRKKSTRPTATPKPSPERDTPTPSKED